MLVAEGSDESNAKKRNLTNLLQESEVEYNVIGSCKRRRVQKGKNCSYYCKEIV